MPNAIHQQKLASLDGWRAVSIALVLWCHSKITTGFPLHPPSRFFYFSEAAGGWGVRFFFVISGFLITHLLLQEHGRNGFIDLKKFYYRRALRILPVCFFYLLFVCFFTKYSQSPGHWVANFTFTTEFFPIYQENPVGHLWSLAIEEQFYIIWPCLLVFTLNRTGAVPKVFKILLLPLIVAPIIRLLHYEHFYPKSLESVFYSISFFTNFDSLASGCLSAWLFNYRRSTVERFCKPVPLAESLGLLLVLVPLYVPFDGRFQAGFFQSLQNMGYSILLLQSVLNPARGVNRMLNWKLVSRIGVLSYSIYIWQQMFCEGKIDFGMDPWWLQFPAWIFVSIGVATCSYYLLERPLLNLRMKLKTI